MWQSFAAIGRETAEISRWRKREETAAKHKGSRVALSQRAALKSFVFYDASRVNENN